MMNFLEIICLAIVFLFIVFQLKYRQDPARFLWRLLLLAIASWLGENTVIHAYHFYSYAPRWTIFLDRVPLLVVLIWPVVIASAWHLVGYLFPARTGWLTLAGGMLVLSDASLIEPIAVQAQLWQWHEPGIFQVPPIGILGWAYFAGCCIFIMEKNSRAKRHAYWDALLLVFPPLLTHLFLLLTWWGGLRWVNSPISAAPMVAIVCTISLVLTYLAWTKESARNIPRMEMLLRIPAALFFFALLAMYGRTNPPLIACAIAFTPPYLVLTIKSGKSQ
jgi:hypothetical protein